MGGLGDHIPRTPFGSEPVQRAQRRMKLRSDHIARDRFGSPLPESQPPLEYEETLRQRAQYLFQSGLEALGVDNYTGRKNAEAVIGLADFSPFGMLTSGDDAR